MDLAEYRTLFVLSFTTPAFDPEVAPSFGTLLATINVALSLLAEVGDGEKVVAAMWLLLLCRCLLFHCLLLLCRLRRRRSQRH